MPGLTGLREFLENPERVMEILLRSRNLHHGTVSPAPDNPGAGAQTQRFRKRGLTTGELHNVPQLHQAFVDRFVPGDMGHRRPVRSMAGDAQTLVGRDNDGAAPTAGQPRAPAGNFPDMAGELTALLKAALLAAGMKHQ